jgi:hypothetical protein
VTWYLYNCVTIFAAVADPAGDWGMAMLRADSLNDVRSLGDAT